MCIYLYFYLLIFDVTFGDFSDQLLVVSIVLLQLRSVCRVVVQNRKIFKDLLIDLTELEKHKMSC